MTDREEQNRVNIAYGDKYVDPYSEARDTIFQKDCDLYRVHIKHIMTWEYGVIGTRTDWRFE